MGLVGLVVISGILLVTAGVALKEPSTVTNGLLALILGALWSIEIQLKRLFYRK